MSLLYYLCICDKTITDWIVDFGNEIPTKQNRKYILSADVSSDDLKEYLYDVFMDNISYDSICTRPKFILTIYDPDFEEYMFKFLSYFPNYGNKYIVKEYILIHPADLQLFCNKNNIMIFTSGKPIIPRKLQRKQKRLYEAKEYEKLRQTFTISIYFGAALENPKYLTDIEARINTQCYYDNYTFYFRNFSKLVKYYIPINVTIERKIYTSANYVYSCVEDKKEVVIGRKTINVAFYFLGVYERYILPHVNFIEIIKAGRYKQDREDDFYKLYETDNIVEIEDIFWNHFCSLDINFFT